MTANEFIKFLRTKKVFYAYVNYSPDEGGYMIQVKNEWIKLLKEVSEEKYFDVSVTDTSIYLN